MPSARPGAGALHIWFETKGSPSGDPLMLLHGFTGTHRTWEASASLLAKRHLLILPDLPGHGRSGVSPSQEEMGVRPTADALASLLLRGGKRRAAIVGYSLGGRVALEMACRHQGLISALVLEGASPGIEDEDERARRRESDSKLADEIERHGTEWFVDVWEGNPIFATQKELPREVFREMRRERLSNSARGLAMSLRSSGPGEMAPLWEEIGGLRIPVLILAGERDRKYAEIGEEMRARIPGSVLALVEGAGHCPHLERPERFAGLVERFLEGRARPLREEESGA